MGSPAIFAGNNVKLLKQNIDLNGQCSILSGTIDPSVTGVAAPIGSVYLKSDGSSYSKTGALNTAWIKQAVAANTAFTPDNLGTFSVEVQGAIGDVSLIATSTATDVLNLTDTFNAHDQSSVVHGATGEIMGTTNIQTATNKTFVKPIIDVLSMTQVATPTTPAAGTTLKYYKSDGKGYILDSSGVETLDGGGGSGGSAGKNYLSDWFDSVKALGTLQTLTLTGNRTTNQDSWGKTATGAFAVNTSSPLRGLQDYKFTPTGINEFIESPMFNLNNADDGKNLDVNMTVNNLGAAGDYTYEIIRYNSSGTYQEALPVYNQYSNKIPTGIMEAPGWFFANSTATDLYALRIKRLTAGVTAIQITDWFFGKAANKLINGAAISDWQSFTPVWSSSGSGPAIGNGTISGKWRQNGPDMELSIALTPGTTTTFGTGTYVFGLPNGYLIDETKLARPTVGSTISDITTLQGSATLFDAAPGAYYYGEPTYYSTQYVSIIGGTASKWGTAFPVTLANGDAISLSCKVPIVGWSSNQTMANRALEEYAFNTTNLTTAGANATTGFGYGANGTPILNYNSTTTTGESKTTFDVEFQFQVQPTDKVFLELNDGTGWMDFSSRLPSATHNVASYGATLIAQSTTKYRVGFGNAGYSPVGGATYGSAGGGWFSLSAWRWRLRKVSGGAVVGYPISTRNLVGDTSGTEVPSGFLSYMSYGTKRQGTGGFTYSTRSTISIPTSPSSVKAIAVALNKGSYLIAMNVSCFITSGSGYITASVNIGNTGISAPQYVPVSSTANGTVSFMLPVVIEADNTEVSTWAQVIGGTSASNNHEAFVIAL